MGGNFSQGPESIHTIIFPLCMFCALSLSSISPILCDSMDCSSEGSFAHGDSPGKNTGVGCPAFVHGIFLI